MNPADLFAHRPADRSDAERQVARIQSLLAAHGLQHRPPPPAPTACCGRGCHGCVWEGYFTALGYWREDARALLSA